MKKYSVLLLVLALTFSLCACASSGGSGQGDSGKNQAESKSFSAEDITFDGLTAVDNDVCRIDINNIDPDGVFGYTLEVGLENRSADKTYMFSVDNAAVNGVASDPLFALDLAPGTKEDQKISFNDTELEKYGITDFTDIAITFKVVDSEDWFADPAVIETVHIYPYGEENASAFVREPADTDNVLVDDDNVSVIVTGFREDEVWGYTADLYLADKTDSGVMFSAGDVSVNGCMIDPIFIKTVMPGTCMFTSMSWSNDELQANGIDKVEEIDLTLRAYKEDLSGVYYVNDVFKLQP